MRPTLQRQPFRERERALRGRSDLNAERLAGGTVDAAAPFCW